MRTPIAALALLLVLSPAAVAQGTIEAPPPDADAPPEGTVGEGLGLLEEGTRMILRGLMDEVEPALRGMGEDLDKLIAEMEPAFRDLARMIGDLRNYHPPEKLPNGDIILRRKVPLDPENPADEGPVDL